jgi:hypothetical protein
MKKITNIIFCLLIINSVGLMSMNEPGPKLTVSGLIATGYPLAEVMSVRFDDGHSVYPVMATINDNNLPVASKMLFLKGYKTSRLDAIKRAEEREINAAARKLKPFKSLTEQQQVRQARERVEFNIRQAEGTEDLNYYF